MAGLLKVYTTDTNEHLKDGYHLPKFSVLRYYDQYINSFFFKIAMQEILSYKVYLEKLESSLGNLVLSQ